MIDKISQQSKISTDAITQNLSLSMARLIMCFKRLERYPRTFGKAGRLTLSEIHTIDAIGCGEGIQMSELAARLDVTKGAVTQIISRLEVKELVCRIPHPTDSRYTIVSLTKTGLLAYQAHAELDQKLYRKFSAQLAPQEIETFKTCIDKLCEILQE
ncbi:MAG: MarR family transcriptional regulator [Firmicutes bacterium]|nr:MarR family transcriptional regulator [Bacillota bacterium]